MLERFLQRAFACNREIDIASLREHKFRGVQEVRVVFFSVQPAHGAHDGSVPWDLETIAEGKPAFLHSAEEMRINCIFHPSDLFLVYAVAEHRRSHGVGDYDYVVEKTEKTKIHLVIEIPDAPVLRRPKKTQAG